MEQTQSRRLGVDVKKQPRQPRGCKACPRGCGRAPHPRGPLVAPLTYLLRLYISTYPENIQEHHEKLFQLSQPSVSARSDLGTFVGAPLEGPPGVGGAPSPRGRAGHPRGRLPCFLTSTPSPLDHVCSKNHAPEGFIPLGLRLIFLFFEILK